MSIANRFPSISIVIPVYQVEDYIVACLESVANQGYPGRVEVIIVDDCGTDSSMELVTVFLNQYRGPFLFKVYSHLTNRGLSAARNTGLEHAIGDYILFVDSDDELLPEALNHLAAPLRQEAFDVIIGRPMKRGSGQTYTRPISPYSVLRGSDCLSEYVKGHLPVVAWNKLYRRQMLMDHSLSFCDGVLFEDELWSFQVAHLADSFFLIKEVTYLYRLRSGSIMTSQDVEGKVSSLRTILSEMQVYAKHNQLFNDCDVLLWIESFRHRILVELCPNKSRFTQEYLKLRKSNLLKWIDYCIIIGLHPIKQIRMFHYALPPRCGALYLYHWIRRTRRQK